MSPPSFDAVQSETGMDRLVNTVEDLFHSIHRMKDQKQNVRNKQVTSADEQRFTSRQLAPRHVFIKWAERFGLKSIL